MDMTNAFGTASRTAIMHALWSNASMRPLVRLAMADLSTAAELLLRREGESELEWAPFKSAAGLQQGAPASPALWSALMDRLLKSIDSKLKSGGGEGGVCAIMDDAYVYGPAERVLSIITAVYMGEGKAVTGCEMNTKDSKGWFFSPAGNRQITTSKAWKAAKRAGCHLKPYAIRDKSGTDVAPALAGHGCVVAGVPLGTDEFVHTVLMRKAKKCSQQMKAVTKTVDLKVNLQLYWSLVYQVVRTQFDHLKRHCYPHQFREAGAYFDRKVLKTVAQVVNFPLSRLQRVAQTEGMQPFVPTRSVRAGEAAADGTTPFPQARMRSEQELKEELEDITMLQRIRLPTRMGGLGVRSVVDTSHAAFLGMVTSVLPTMLHNKDAVGIAPHLQDLLGDMQKGRDGWWRQLLQHTDTSTLARAVRDAVVWLKQEAALPTEGCLAPAAAKVGEQLKDRPQHHYTEEVELVRARRMCTQIKGQPWWKQSTILSAALNFPLHRGAETAVTALPAGEQRLTTDELQCQFAAILGTPVPAVEAARVEVGGRANLRVPTTEGKQTKVVVGDTGNNLLAAKSATKAWVQAHAMMQSWVRDIIASVTACAPELEAPHRWQAADDDDKAIYIQDIVTTLWAEFNAHGEILPATFTRLAVEIKRINVFNVQGRPEDEGATGRELYYLGGIDLSSPWRRPDPATDAYERSQLRELELRYTKRDKDAATRKANDPGFHSRQFEALNKHLRVLVFGKFGEVNATALHFISQLAAQATKQCPRQMNQATAERTRALFTSYYRTALAIIVVKANTSALLRCLSLAKNAAKGAQAVQTGRLVEYRAAQYGARDNAAYQPFVRPAPPAPILTGANLLNRASDARAPLAGHDDHRGQDRTPVCEAAHLIAASLGPLSKEEAQQVNNNDARGASRAARGRLQHTPAAGATCPGGCGRAPDRCSCEACRHCGNASHACICAAARVQLEGDSPESAPPRTSEALHALQELMLGDSPAADTICPLAKRAAEFDRLASGRASTPGVTPAAVITIWRENPVTNPRAEPAVAWLQFHPYPATEAPLAAAARLTGHPMTMYTQPETYTTWAVTWPSECAGSWHSHLPPHPAWLLVVAHGGRAALVPFRPAAATWAADGGDGADSTKVDRIRREAQAVWWRNSDHMGRDDPTNRVWGEPLAPLEQLRQHRCPNCSLNAATEYHLEQHIAAGCSAEHPRAARTEKTTGRKDKHDIIASARITPRRGRSADTTGIPASAPSN